MTPRQQQAFKFFLSKGYVPEGAAAIVGNLSQESGVNLNSQFMRTTDHGSQGIAQWRLDRLTGLERFAEDNRMPVTDLMTQMLYLIDELTSAPYRGLNAMLRTGGRSVANLTANFMAIFERPSAKYANLDNRIRQANLALTAAPQVPPKTSRGPEIAGAGAGAAASAGGAAYAWSLGLHGQLIVALATLAVAAALVAAFHILRGARAKESPIVLASPHPSGELQRAIDEFKAAAEHLDAAEAVLLTDRQAGDDLLAQVKAIKGFKQ